MRWVIWITVLVSPFVAATWAEAEMAKIPEEVRILAARDGIVRVIVEVSASAASGPETATAGTRGFCANSDCAKLQVRTALEGENAPVVEDLGDALLLMEVTPDGLRALEAAPLVARVTVDAPVPLPPEPDADTRDVPPQLDAPQGG